MDLWCLCCHTLVAHTRDDTLDTEDRDGYRCETCGAPYLRLKDSVLLAPRRPTPVRHPQRDR